MSEQSYNILVVEDEWLNANYISQILETLGHSVVDIVSSAKKALASIEKYQIDFIFMDINIDGPQDGITLAHKVNEKSTIPIIYMTAFGDSETIQEASQTNIYGFIIKPFNERGVEAVLNVAIQRILQEMKHTKELLREEEKPSSLMNLGSMYTFDLKKSTLYFNGKMIVFSKNESKLLHLFCMHYKHVVSTETIRREVWEGKEVGESTIRDTVLRVRKKIIPLRLENITGMGYVLQKEDS